MDPDGKWTSTRAVLLAAAGQNRWPPAGSYMAATGQDLMAADSHRLAIASPRQYEAGTTSFKQPPHRLPPLTPRHAPAARRK